jgi:hypothetical protein
MANVCGVGLSLGVNKGVTEMNALQLEKKYAERCFSIAITFLFKRHSSNSVNS